MTPESSVDAGNESTTAVENQPAQSAEEDAQPSTKESTSLRKPNYSKSAPNRYKNVSTTSRPVRPVSEKHIPTKSRPISNERLRDLDHYGIDSRKSVGFYQTPTGYLAGQTPHYTVSDTERETEALYADQPIPINWEAVHMGSEMQVIRPESESSPELAECSLDMERHTLNVLGLSYYMNVYSGPWYTGCCLRPLVQHQLLRNISVHVKSGEITALLGNSGSGKTSLLDAIACRTHYPTQVIGGVFVNNQLMNKYIFRAIAGYVVQDDRHVPNLTVRETLNYIAKLKFAEGVPTKIIEGRVDRTIDLMGLQLVADSLVGGTVNRGISGGEKRRLSIAIQLLQDPKILLLDEPTTGLDSFTAYYLVRNLADIAFKQNKIILMTIHQPRSDIFRLFGCVGILCQGEMVYQGPSSQLVPYFTSLGFPCPTFANPLDHYLDLASIDRRGGSYQETSEIRVNDLKMAFFLSDIFRKNLAEIHEYTRCTAGAIQPIRDSYLKVAIRPRGFFYVVFTLWMRLNVNLWRDRVAHGMRIFQATLLVPFMWLFILRLDKTQASVQDRNGLLYQVVQSSSYLGLLNAVALFPPLLKLYIRESRDGLYGATSFLLSYFAHILPYTLISNILFSSWLYWAVGLQADMQRFLVFLFVLSGLAYWGETMAIFFLGLFLNVSIANSATALVISIAGMISSGFIRSEENLLLAFRRLSDLNIYKYSSQILVANEFEGLKFSCDANASLPCQFKTGDDYLRLYYPTADIDRSFNFGICCLYIIFSVFMTLVLYKACGQRHRNLEVH